MKISKEIQLDYGHTLPNHYSFCNQIHGHRARIIATIEGEVSKKEGDSNQGMVLDFKFLKEAMMNNIHAVLDHGFAVWCLDGDDLNFIANRNKKFLVTFQPPTAEYLAEWAFYQIVNEVPKPLKLVEVQWWETPSSVATYLAPAPLVKQ